MHNKIETLEYTLELDSYDATTDTLRFNPLYEDDKLLNFSTSKERNHLDLILVGKANFVFKDVNLYNERLDNVTAFHCCQGNYKSEQNMRESTRHVVNYLCDYSRGSHRGVCQALVKDISLTGFSVIVDGKINFTDDPVIDIIFSESYIIQGHLKLTGKIVRVVGDNEDVSSRKLVGFRLEHDNVLYRKWIMALERERAKNLRKV
jgi:hypothetical protein